MKSTSGCRTEQHWKFVLSSRGAAPELHIPACHAENVDPEVPELLDFRRS